MVRSGSLVRPAGVCLAADAFDGIGRAADFLGVALATRLAAAGLPELECTDRFIFQV